MKQRGRETEIELKITLAIWWKRSSFEFLKIG